MKGWVWEETRNNSVVGFDQTQLMKILVFDDSAKNLDSAKRLLGKDHSLTLVSTYDEAEVALTPKTDYDLRNRLLKERIYVEVGLPGDYNPYSGNKSDSERAKSKIAYDKAMELATRYPDFDVVLTDLFVPASGNAQGPEGLPFVGKEMPIGTTIALLAIRAGVKNVAVVTDINHHNHPAAAMFDAFADWSGCRAGAVNIHCVNNIHSIAIDSATDEVINSDYLYSAEGRTRYFYPSSEGGREKGFVWGGKDWSRVLSNLLGSGAA